MIIRNLLLFITMFLAQALHSISFEKCEFNVSGSLMLVVMLG